MAWLCHATHAFRAPPATPLAPRATTPFATLQGVPPSRRPFYSPLSTLLSPEQPRPTLRFRACHPAEGRSTLYFLLSTFYSLMPGANHALRYAPGRATQPKAVLLSTFYSLKPRATTPYATLQGVPPSRRPFYSLKPEQPRPSLRSRACHPAVGCCSTLYSLSSTLSQAPTTRVDKQALVYRHPNC